MKLAVSIGLFLTFAAVFQETRVTSFKDDEWDYKEKGPATDAWCKASKKCCEGERQSPFTLRRGMYYSFDLDNFTWIDYDKEIELTGLNNGKTVVFMLKDSSVQPVIGGADMDKMYKFHSIQFHWGKNWTMGSEHAFNGPRHKGEMEVQLVHYKSKFNGYDEAVDSNETDALAIISILYAIAVKTQEFSVHRLLTDNSSTAMTSIVNSLPNIIKPGQTTTVTIKLQDLYAARKIPDIFPYLPVPPETLVKSFRGYMGSLTAPPCYEIVRWYIFEVMTRIPEDQLNVFRKLEGEDSTELSNNFRPLNPKKDLVKLIKIKKGGRKGGWKPAK